MNINGRITVRVLTRDKAKVSPKVSPEAAGYVESRLPEITPMVERYWAMKADTGTTQELYQLLDEITIAVGLIENEATKIQNG